MTASAAAIQTSNYRAIVSYWALLPLYTPSVGEPGSTAAHRRPWSNLEERLVRTLYQRADAALDQGQSQVFRLLCFFLPEPAIARDLRIQQLLVSRWLSDAGQQALSYGALIAVVRQGGSALDAALLGASALLPPALLGLYGGAVADALPKRVALAATYNAQALLCFLAPTLLGIDLLGMMILLFGVNALGQVSGPTESSILPTVSNDAQLASGASLLSFASSLGTAFGTAVLAPVVVRAFGVEFVIYASGILLLLAASRVFDLKHEGVQPEPRINIDVFRRRVNARITISWLAQQPAVATMVVVAVLAGPAQIVLQVLAPRYVESVLQVDAADAVYVFAPSAAGLAAALILAPTIIRLRGERAAALFGFCLIAGTLVCLGFISRLTSLNAVNPLSALSLVGLELAPRLRVAAVLAVPMGFGVALTTTSVQTYINRRVPLALQARTFALQSTLKNGTAILPLTVLGAAAGIFGVEAVLLVSPLILLAVAYGLILLSTYFGGSARGGPLGVFPSFWEEPPAPKLTSSS